MPNIKEKWDEIKEYVKVEYGLNPVSYDTWVKPLKFYDVIGNSVRIVYSSDNSLAKKYLNSKYKDFFQVAIAEISNESYDVQFILENETDLNEEDEYIDITNTQNYKNSNLNPKYRFDTFVIGSNNKLAHSAALAVAESPGEIYNPLYIYGGAGLGKTHLMHSIGHFILESKNDTKVTYVTSEAFMNDVIENIRSGNQQNLSKMREKYRNVDVLMVDDIQYIIGRDRTQEEFFNTFNELHLAGKQIIISSDKPPKELKTLDERFKTRFGMGLIVDIQAPDFETRMAILRQLAENNKKNIDDSIIKYIADNVKSDIRALEGAFNQIINLFRTENASNITLKDAENALKNIVSQNNSNNITPDYILDIICKEYNVSPEDIKSSRRNQELVTPRHLFMFLCRIIVDMTYDDIAKFLNRKDHTTIMHGYKKIKEDISSNPDFELKVNNIKNKINSQY